MALGEGDVSYERGTPVRLLHTEMCSGFEAGSHLSFIDLCITQRQVLEMWALASIPDALVATQQSSFALPVYSLLSSLFSALLPSS